MKLTKSEEEIMQFFWDYGPSKVSEIQDRMPEPKPALTTISTIVRILEGKRVLGHTKEGRGYRYHALLTREKYRSTSLKSLLSRYFNGKPEALVSHLVNEEILDTERLEELLDQIKNQEDGTDD